MAKKKKDEGEGGGGSPAWMATFSDLMNLLLCFFVLLFSMSTVDAEKYEALLASLTGNFSVFQSGSSMVGESVYVASGATQMVEVNKYFAEFTEEGGQQGFKQFDNIEEYEKELEKQKAQEAEELYEEVVKRTEEEKLDDIVAVDKDESNQYVRISIGGAVLFNSGDASIKKEARSILSRVGDILETYKDHLKKIEGHTDNVKMSGGKYENNWELSTARASSVLDFMLSKKNIDPVTLEVSGRGEYVPIADNGTAEGRAKNRRVEFKIYTDIIK